MLEGTTAEGPLVQRSTAHASLAVLGVHLRQLHLFDPIREQVHIPQKAVRYTPADKLYDAFIALLAGAHGLVEINGRLRTDTALQMAFGRSACAEQSVVQDTLDACTQETVQQMEAAWNLIFRRQSQASRHPYPTRWQILDVDMSGMPCGKKAALASAGYFAKQRNRRGRQLGRVLATCYHEIVVDRLFDGKTQLNVALLPLVCAAEATLELDEAKRERTLVRIDAGAGSISDINWLLMRGYFVLSKDYSTARARLLAQHVTDWYVDPRDPERQVGLVPVPATDYHAGQYRRPITRVAVRCRLANGQWGVGVVVCSLPLTDACALAGLDPTANDPADPATIALAYVYLYDQRGGGVETSFKQDKQGLGITKRSKKRLAAQQVVVALGALAHNVLVWGKRWLQGPCPRLARFGVKRLVRDVFGIGGRVEFDAHGHVICIVLNQADRYAHWLLVALQTLASSADVAVRLGET
jgi:Transposase DDE domain group 1